MRCNFCKTKFERKYPWQMGKLKYCQETEECKTECSKAIANKLREQQEKKRKSDKVNKRKIHSNLFVTENKSTLQKEINHIVRLIDKDVSCIDCHRTESPIFDAGHYRSSGSNSTLRYHLDNIFRQTRHCNSFSEGNKGVFKEGIEQMYGITYLEHVEGLNQRYKLIKLHHSEYPDIITEARKVVRELKKVDMVYSATVRIRLRKEINLRLGIYK